MQTDLAAQIVTMNAAQTRQLATIAVMRKQHQMQQQLVDLIDTVTRAAPQPGQGAHVDKTA
jgi:hypothetical protein